MLQFDKQNIENQKPSHASKSPPLVLILVGDESSHESEPISQSELRLESEENLVMNLHISESSLIDLERNTDDRADATD